MGHSVKAIEARVRGLLSDERVEHTLGVVDMAQRLAVRYDCRQDKAGVAALLHDCARDLGREDLLKRILEFGIVVDEIEERNPVLLHAGVGAEMARSDFGVQDADVLNAIRFHTTGRPGMSTLEQVVFLADCIEEAREYTGIEEARGLAFRDLRSACLRALSSTLGYILSQGTLIHPRTLEAYNWMLLSRNSYAGGHRRPL